LNIARSARKIGLSAQSTSSETIGEALSASISSLASRFYVSSLATLVLASSSEALSSFPHLLGLSKHIITVIRQQAKLFIILMQEGKLVTYLIIGVGIRVALVTLIAVGAKRHGAEAISSKAAQPTQVLG
jgi:hypothetical protein